MVKVLFIIAIFAVAVVALYYGVVFAASAIAKAVDDKRKSLQAELDRTRAHAVASDKALSDAERSLRAIANGAGVPQLEAQIALDELNNNYHSKELN